MTFTDEDMARLKYYYSQCAKDGTLSSRLRLNKLSSADWEWIATVTNDFPDLLARLKAAEAVVEMVPTNIRGMGFTMAIKAWLRSCGRVK